MDPLSNKCLHKGLLAGESWVCDKCHGIGSIATQRHGRSEVHEETQSVSKSEKGPCVGKCVYYYFFLLLLLLLLLFFTLKVLIVFFYHYILSLKAVQSAHMAEELVNKSHQQMKEEEERQIAAVEAFSFAEKRIQELNTKLTKAGRDKKSAEAALQGAKRQVESQRKQLCQTEDQLTAVKEQIGALKKKQEEIEVVVEKAEQDGYDVGMAEIEETLRVEVSGVCRTYCLQVWNEAFNQARVEASSAFRRAESVYYPPTIQALSPSGSKAENAPKNPNPSKDAFAKALCSPNSSPKQAEQVGTVEKEIVKEVAPEAPKPPAAPKDSFKKGRVSGAKKLFWQPSPFPPKRILRVKVQPPQQLQLPNPLSVHLDTTYFTKN